MLNQLKKLISSNKLFIFFTLLFLYAMMYILLKNVIQAKEYHFHIRTLGYILIFGLLFYYFAQNTFKNHFKRLQNRQIIFLILSALFLSYGINLTVKKRIEKKVHDKKVFLNPLSSKYEILAKKYNIDISFTKFTKEQRGPINYKISTIYSKKPKSIDILFIGDSTLAWGTIPEIIEQISHKNIAIYAYESNIMTEKTAKLFDMIAKYYLKDNGTLILSFTNSFYAKNPNSLLISKKQYKQITSLNNEEFRSFIKKQENKRNHPFILNQDALIDLKKRNLTKKNKDQSWFKSYQNRYKQLSQYLSKKYYMNLKSIDFYTLYLEEYINPKWNKTKNINIKNDTTMFLRWNMNTITLYDPNFNKYSIHSEAIPIKELHNKNIERNAIAASKIYGQKKIFIVPIFNKDKHYVSSRNIYKTYYKKLGFKLCDLGLDHPKNEKYPMQSSAHMGNEGGLMQSILIGKWIKKYLGD